MEIASCCVVEQHLLNATYALGNLNSVDPSKEHVLKARKLKVIKTEGSPLRIDDSKPRTNIGAIFNHDVTKYRKPKDNPERTVMHDKRCKYHQVARGL